MTNQTNLLLSQFEIGDRVALRPSTDSWLRGDRFGEIVKIGRFYLHVKLDRSGRTRRFVPEHISRKVTP